MGIMVRVARAFFVLNVVRFVLCCDRSLLCTAIYFIVISPVAHLPNPKLYKH